MQVGALVLTRSGKLETKPVSLSFLSKVSTNAAWGLMSLRLSQPNRKPAKRLRFGEEEQRSDTQFSPSGGNGASAVCSDEAADTTAELGCGSACHGKPPRVSCDPSGYGSVRGGIPALPAARSDTAHSC